jgi:hypothetical protein
MEHIFHDNASALAFVQLIEDRHDAVFTPTYTYSHLLVTHETPTSNDVVANLWDAKVVFADQDLAFSVQEHWRQAKLTWSVVDRLLRLCGPTGDDVLFEEAVNTYIMRDLNDRGLSVHTTSANAKEDPIMFKFSERIVVAPPANNDSHGRLDAVVNSIVGMDKQKAASNGHPYFVCPTGCPVFDSLTCEFDHSGKTISVHTFQITKSEQYDFDDASWRYFSAALAKRLSEFTVSLTYTYMLPQGVRCTSAHQVPVGAQRQFITMDAASKVLDVVQSPVWLTNTSIWA